jgi:PAS domain S-box-containing protein
MSLEPLSSLTLMLFVAASISGVLLLQSIVSAGRERLPRSLPVFLAGITVWLLAYAWELSAPDLTTKILASKVQYFGIAIVPTAWLLYTVSYAQLDRRFNLVYRLLLCIEPVLVVMLVWTNESHHLIWKSLQLTPASSNLVLMRITYGPLFYGHAVYCYALVVWATTLLLRTLGRSFGLYRSQVSTLLISAIAPWLGNILYLLNQSQLLARSTSHQSGSDLWLIDWTPFGFLITGLTVLWGRWRFRLWETVPIARDALIEGMRDGILVIDRQNRVVDVNPAIQTILNLPISKVIGQPASRILAPWPLLLNQLLSAPHQHRLVTHEQRYGSSLHWHEISLSPLYNLRRQLLGQLLVWRDVTSKKTIELELAKAKEVAESASQAKSRFLATMSHEFRTPLSAILGYSELLQEDCKLKGYTELLGDLDTIRCAGSNLLSLINNVLEFSKVEAGKLSLYLESFDVIALVLEVSNIVEPLMMKNKNQLQVHYSEEIQSIYSDPVKVRQILLNVLGNAAKFTTEGTVTLSVEPLNAAQNGPIHLAAPAENAEAPEWIRFQVRDTGIGMTPEQLQRVFHAFVQAEQSTSRHYGGTGLGLALSQSLCQIMGGAISAESTFGEGSTFTIDLPIHCSVLGESSLELGV